MYVLKDLPVKHKLTKYARILMISAREMVR